MRQPALARRRAEKRHRAADVVDRDLLVQHALVVERAFDDEEIGLRLGGDPPRHRIFGIDRKRRRRLQRRAPPDRDAPARSAPCGRPASPCRCPSARRSERHAARGRSDRRQARPLRRSSWPNRTVVARGCGARRSRRLVVCRAVLTTHRLHDDRVFDDAPDGRRLEPRFHRIPNCFARRLPSRAPASMTTQRLGSSAAIAR